MYVVVSIYSTDPVCTECVTEYVAPTLEDAIKHAQSIHLHGYDVISITKIC